jgi:EAL domain-containing protein (putative c-di-GMP-specific phosphodiesterase class I)
MNAAALEKLALGNKLRKALELEQFVLFYQPKVDLNTGRVAGLKALMRRNDPESGLVMPMRFIPLLEETDMIVKLGAWAMKRAVSQYAAWQAAGLQPPIAVNVSQVQLKRKDFVTSVHQKSRGGDIDRRFWHGLLIAALPHAAAGYCVEDRPRFYPAYDDEPG